MSHIGVTSDTAQRVISGVMGAPGTQPTNVIINVNDPKQKESDNGKKNRNQLPPETPFQYWIRRIFIGKNEEEEENEHKHHKKLNFFKKEMRRHVAEFVGSFFIVFFIAGIQINQNLIPSGGVWNIDKGLVAGFLLVGLIFCFGKVSGAHFNPCVTLGFTLRGAFDFPRFITYVIIQFAGAVSGAAVLYGLFGNVNGLGTTTPGVGIQAKEAFGVEILCTFLLITVILTTSENAQILGPASGLAVGAMFGAIELWAWNFSGASVNPWRTIGPTIISGKGWDTYWVYRITSKYLTAGVSLKFEVSRVKSRENSYRGKLGFGKGNSKARFSGERVVCAKVSSTARCVEDGIKIALSGGFLFHGGEIYL